MVLLKAVRKAGEKVSTGVARSAVEMDGIQVVEKGDSLVSPQAALSVEKKVIEKERLMAVR